MSFESFEQGRPTPPGEPPRDATTGAAIDSGDDDPQDAPDVDVGGDAPAAVPADPPDSNPAPIAPAPGEGPAAAPPTSPDDPDRTTGGG